MAHNLPRASRMAMRSIGELTRFVDAGSLSSAAAEYELTKRGIIYTVTQQRV
jgi:hypothetical protein